jgi:hypothetical protein
MQTQAAPREPFTLGVLLRYKFTIFTVGVFVIIGGYLRTVTQPSLYEATARLAVRFTSEAMALSSIREGGNYFRTPLLEEEVKAHMVQLSDPQFINQVLEALPIDKSSGPGPNPTLQPTATERFRTQFLEMYYGIRKSAVAFFDAVLMTGDKLISEREQQVMQVINRLEVTSGTEASHIITASFQSMDPISAAKMVNTLCLEFIELQKKRVKQKDEAEALRAVEAAMTELVDNRKELFRINNKIGSPTLEGAIQHKYSTLQRLRERKRTLEEARGLLEKGLCPYDKDLPLETPVLQSELERQYFELRMGAAQEKKNNPENRQYFDEELDRLDAHMAQRMEASRQRDKIVVQTQIDGLNEDIEKLVNDSLLEEITAKYTKHFLAQGIIETRMSLAAKELNAVREFNDELVNENVSENIALHQKAGVPPFPLPQHRGLKLLVVIALGFFVGCGAALLRHQVRPKPIRIVRPHAEEEVDVPIIILPDDGASDLELDISFPKDDGAQEQSRTVR